MKREFIPRPLRACLWALLAILVAGVYYIALGCPATFRQEFRRAEKAHMVGPSQIVDQINERQYSEFDKMLVGETEHGICFFGKYIANKENLKDRWTDYRFQYVQKTGDVTFAAAPHFAGYWGLYSLPIYVFTEADSATRCTISIHSTGTQGLDPFDETFQAEAERHPNGFFRFILTGSEDEQRLAMTNLSTLCMDGAQFDGNHAQIQIKLFDANGNELLTKDLHLGSV